ncbi:hypothetical protein TNCV_109511 [Trichonephila clavipes]|nr:hypothetical protein TNCV_109511 [Trichonephila clavipes]
MWEKSGLLRPILSLEFKTAKMLVKTKRLLFPHYLRTFEPERYGNYYCRVRRAYTLNEGEKKPRERKTKINYPAPLRGVCVKDQSNSDPTKPVAVLLGGGRESQDGETMAEEIINHEGRNGDS